MPAGLTSGASAAFAFVRSLKPYPGPFGFIPRDELHPPARSRADWISKRCRQQPICTLGTDDQLTNKNGQKGPMTAKKGGHPPTLMLDFTGR
jgi:hypothetical protein